MKIVVKVGTSTLTHVTGCVNIRRIEKLVKVLSDIKNAGNQVILVSSGAIAMGVGKLNLEKRPDDIAGKQAAAAVGQCELMLTFLFREAARDLSGRVLKMPLSLALKRERESATYMSTRTRILRKL